MQIHHLRGTSKIINKTFTADLVLKGWGNLGQMGWYDITGKIKYLAMLMILKT